MSIEDIYRMIKVSPFGKMGGIYNILRLAESRTKVEASNLQIDLATVMEVILLKTILEYYY